MPYNGNIKCIIILYETLSKVFEIRNCKIYRIIISGLGYKYFN